MSPPPVPNECKFICPSISENYNLNCTPFFVCELTKVAIATLSKKKKKKKKRKLTLRGIKKQALLKMPASNLHISTFFDFSTMIQHILI